MARKPKKDQTKTIVEIGEDTIKNTSVIGPVFETQQEVIDHLLAKLSIKESEVAQLKIMISKMELPQREMISINPSDEELIADIQLSKLKESAKTRELTLEEVKKYDLLVKNKRLTQTTPTTIDVRKQELQAYTPDELIRLVTNVDSGGSSEQNEG